MFCIYCSFCMYRYLGKVGSVVTEYVTHKLELRNGWKIIKLSRLYTTKLGRGDGWVRYFAHMPKIECLKICYECSHFQGFRRKKCALKLRMHAMHMKVNNVYNRIRLKMIRTYSLISNKHTIFSTFQQ